jgi:hypothetical protein
MSEIFPGRYTAQSDRPFVVFLIGMRINRLWAVHKWLPVFGAMGPMIARLYQYPEQGFLGGRTLVGSRGPTMIQYWSSFEDLEKFARSPSEPHLESWKRFNRAAGKDGSAGVWHETYQVAPGSYEAIYVNMPRFGLASVMEHRPAGGRYETARSRMQA